MISPGAPISERLGGIASHAPCHGLCHAPVTLRGYVLFSYLEAL